MGERMQVPGDKKAANESEFETGNQGGAGQSGGGAYPNPHSGKDSGSEGPLGHGGQTEIGYHGTSQLGKDKVEGQDNANSATRKG